MIIDKDYAEVALLHRDDIKSAGFDSNIDDTTLEAIASELGDAIMETYWLALQDLCVKFNLKEIEDEGN